VWKGYEIESQTACELAISLAILENLKKNSTFYFAKAKAQVDSKEGLPRWHAHVLSTSPMSSN